MQWLNPLFSWCLLPIHYLLGALLPTAHMGMLDGNLHSFYEQIFLSHLWLLPSLHLFLRYTHTFTVFIRKSSNYPGRWQPGIFWAVASMLVGRSLSPNSGKGTPACPLSLGLARSCEGHMVILQLSRWPAWFLPIIIFNLGLGEALWTGVLGWRSRKAHSVFGLT